MINEHWLQFKLLSVLTPNKRVNLGYEALRPEIVLLSSCGSLRWCLLIIDVSLVYTLKII